MVSVPGVWCRYAKKLKYRTETACAVAIRMERPPVDVVPYRCPMCKDWHMTSKPETVANHRERKAK